MQHQRYFVPNLPPQCDTITTICLKTFDINTNRYIAINIAILCHTPNHPTHPKPDWKSSLLNSNSSIPFAKWLLTFDKNCKQPFTSPMDIGAGAVVCKATSDFWDDEKVENFRRRNLAKLCNFEKQKYWILYSVFAFEVKLVLLCSKICCLLKNMF